MTWRSALLQRLQEVRGNCKTRNQLLVYSVTPGTFVDFIDGVVPVLQARGLVQREYTPGPLRQKIFGQARLPARHPAVAYRRG